MEHKKAIAIIQSLIDSVDPYTGRVFDPNSRYMNVEIIKALSEAVEILKKASRENRKKPLPEGTGKAWDETESALLVRRFDEGVAIRELAFEHQRPRREIKALLIKLGKWSSQYPERVGKKWEQAESELLAKRFDSGMQLSQIAKEHQRTKGAIAARLVRIGKVASRDEVLIGRKYNKSGM